MSPNLAQLPQGKGNGNEEPTPHEDTQEKEDYNIPERRMRGGDGRESISTAVGEGGEGMT